MSKFTVSNYLNSQISIFKFPDHYVNMHVRFDSTLVSANGEGKKIIKAGTPICTVTASPAKDLLTNTSAKAKACNNATDGARTEGFLVHDLDVTYGDQSAAICIHGFIDQAKVEDYLGAVLDATVVTACAGVGSTIKLIK